MCDKMAISAYILKIVEKEPFLRLQMRAKKMFHRSVRIRIKWGNKNPHSVPHPDPQGRLDKSMSPRVGDFAQKIISHLIIQGGGTLGVTLDRAIMPAVEICQSKFRSAGK